MVDKKLQDEPDVGDDLTLDDYLRLQFRFRAEHACELADYHIGKRNRMTLGQSEIDVARAAAKIWSDLADRIERSISDSQTKTRRTRR